MLHQLTHIHLGFVVQITSRPIKNDFQTIRETTVNILENGNAPHLFLGVGVLSSYLGLATGYPEGLFVFFNPSRKIPGLYIH
jgi:hypothetical protein